MAHGEYIDVDPTQLRLMGSRIVGADPTKLARQFQRFGLSTSAMPPPEVKRGTDGELVLYDGVTRATRVAKYLPGMKIRVIVTGQLLAAVGHFPKLGDTL
jgi:hypothetical protein